MQVLIFDGSPHKDGDTAALTGAFCEAFGGEAERIGAYELVGKVSACVDCRYCWTHEGCCIRDGMQEIYAKIERADCIVIASPVYYSLLTGPLLSLLSRLQCAYTNRRFLGKRMFVREKVGAVLLAGGGDGRPDPALEAAETLLRAMRAQCRGSAMALKTDALPAREDAAAMDAARRLGALCRDELTRE